jgi:hypothetical protein
MKNRSRISLIKSLVISLLFALLISVRSYGQDQLGLYACGLTIHLSGDKNAALMPLKLDDKGIFVFNYGGALQYLKQLKNRWSVDSEFSLQADCCLKFSWAAGVSIGYDFIKSPEHQFILAIGPFIYCRKNWDSMDGYLQVEDLKVTANKKWEYKIAPAPHLEYTRFPKDGRLGVSTYCVFDPIYLLCNFGFGVNYRLHTKPLS